MRVLVKDVESGDNDIKREGGHWVLLGGYDPNSSGTLLLYDNGRSVPVYVQPYKPHWLVGDGFYQIKFDPKVRLWAKDKIYLLTGAIKAKV